MGLDEYPYPNRSIAATLHPPLASSGTFFLQWSAFPPKPWTQTRSGPLLLLSLEEGEEVLFPSPWLSTPSSSPKPALV